MEDELETRPIRLVNFVSEEQLDEARKTRGERVEDGSAQRGRPLYEILRENKEKKDAEFNERFKHRPPKALDEDETEFLEKMEMSRKEYEQQIANEDAMQLRLFQEAVATQASIVHELKETPAIPKPEEIIHVVKKGQNSRPGNVIISVKPQAKKAKIEASASQSAKYRDSLSPSDGPADKKSASDTIGVLVSYSDESDDE